MRKQWTENPEKFRKEILEQGFGQMGKLSAFRISGTRSKGEDQTEVLVQVTIDVQPMPLLLRRVGGEWKVGD